MPRIVAIEHVHDPLGVRLDLGWGTHFVDRLARIWIHKHKVSSVWSVSIVPNNDRVARFEVGSASTFEDATAIARGLLRMNKESRDRKHH